MKARYCWLLVAIVVMLDVRAAQAQCTSSVTPTSVSVSSIGQTSALSVVSGTNCTWTAVSLVPWITVNSATGHGIGQVNYTVAGNTTGVVRVGTMTVAGQTVTFTQAANSCTYSVTPTSVSVAAIGGPSGLSVTAGTTCSWTAVSNVAWITITSGASGSGIGGVNYTVATNTGVARTGTLTVAGQTVTFSQAAGSGATVPPPPTNLRIVR